MPRPTSPPPLRSSPSPNIPRLRGRGNRHRVYLEANWIGRRSRLMIPVKETTGKKRIKSGKEQHLISVTTVKNASPQLSRQEVEADPVGEASKIFSQQGHSIFNFKIDIHWR
ncbi:hypothetical protein Tsubulata_012976 [Turnera subulata]|uniref:Uncharacterized protein n=1 Tax=Turnera subulata TaxID=218843 RepID=A0A9Q0J365_9ROSI|nr:hypothetical protein Tsubulata_012976 [Turnera subulata]